MPGVPRFTPQQSRSSASTVRLTHAATAETSEPALDELQVRCPMAGGRLFTRLTETEPARCPMAGDRAFTSVEREYMPFKVSGRISLAAGQRVSLSEEGVPVKS